MPKELFDGTFQFVRETDKAICVAEGENDTYWLPKSQVEYNEFITYSRGDKIEVTMPMWLAQEKGIV